MAVVRWPLLLISVLADSSSFNSFVERHGGSYGYGMENFEAFVESNMPGEIIPPVVGNPMGAVIYIYCIYS